jgi:amino acid transporter
MQTPLAFMAAGIVAAFTALSYAELACRIPRSAGEAAYASAAFSNRIPAILAGVGVILTGIISAATISNAFVGYLHEFFPANRELTIFLTVLLLGSVAAWGVTESVTAAAIVTCLEILGIIIVIFFSGAEMGDFTARLPEFIPTAESASWMGIASAAFLAFFAFIGFEDIVNMSEETHKPERNVPRAILFSLVLSTFFYMILATVAVLAMPPSELAKTDAPFTALLAHHGQFATTGITLISLVAVINGALIQIVMASRVLYGMSAQRLLPTIFAKIHPRRRTPIIATALVTAIVLSLALLFKRVALAEATSAITLAVFCLINVSLVIIQRKSSVPEGGFSAPRWVPVVGAILCLAMLIFSVIAS